MPPSDDNPTHPLHPQERNVGTEVQLALLNSNIITLTNRFDDFVTDYRDSKRTNDARIRELELMVKDLSTRMTIFSVGTASLSILASAIAAAIMYALTR